MFNYVVKDPDSSRLSGEFWIKDSDGLGRNRVSSNLCGACVYLQFAYRRSLVQGSYSTRLRLAQRLTTFSNNFLRVSSFSACVNFFSLTPLTGQIPTVTEACDSKVLLQRTTKNIRTARCRGALSSWFGGDRQSDSTANVKKSFDLS